MNDPIRRLRSRHVANGDNPWKLALLPCGAVIVTQRDKSPRAIRAQLLLVEQIGDEKQPARLQPDDTRPLPAPQRTERRLRFLPRLSAVPAHGLRHEAVDLRIFAAVADQRT